MRTVGVEEEFLLVDAEGQPSAVAAEVLANIGAGADDQNLDTACGGGSFGHEFHQQQLETTTSPHACMEALEADVRSLRAVAIAGARKAGAGSSLLARRRC